VVRRISPSQDRTGLCCCQFCPPQIPTVPQDNDLVVPRKYAGEQECPGMILSEIRSSKTSAKPSSTAAAAKVDHVCDEVGSEQFCHSKALRLPHTSCLQSSPIEANCWRATAASLNIHARNHRCEKSVLVFAFRRAQQEAWKAPTRGSSLLRPKH